MRETENRLKKATKSQQVSVCIDMYKQLSQNVNNSLVENFEKNYEFLEDNLKNINKTIWNFIESIK